MTLERHPTGLERHPIWLERRPIELECHLIELEHHPIELEWNLIELGSRRIELDGHPIQITNFPSPRQHKHKPCSLPRLALHADRSTVRFDDAARDGQAQSCAARGAAA